ncbi:helix-turn-helix domain-containing protein [Candidatus Nomurabacteria bacterium]|uniref:Helix-turn-helix domain-containing protein n=1 Tax=candidate division WWE3 bacterium TaxID=2053526 RepID=A0A955E0X2_UNCKA|nr:helix-turn-helix domain-containing protein [candidate division WWE3 bacterium]MCB9823612.1 helix-turn-helix domain-containing protein [Candidatus Nomurabacteria bacterium]MCB9827407.1 helix-turn-helix domain-containing protein [Candidatus Nomurabacteria bacterium]
MKLDDRFYTSTEVAEILGVSLRSVYRYLEEGKIDAEIKTATGRHRFTKQNIMDFLYPSQHDGSSESNQQQSTNKYTVSRDLDSANNVSSQDNKLAGDEDDDLDLFSDVQDEEDDVISEQAQGEEIDWLAKFRAAAQKYSQNPASDTQDKSAQDKTLEDGSDEVLSDVTDSYYDTARQQESLDSLLDTSDDGLAGVEEEYEDDGDLPVDYVPVQQKKVADKIEKYYTSDVGGLRELAQYINKASRKSNVPYAFTMNSGMSLHKLIRPFSVLHAYVKDTDLEFFEKSLELTESDAGNAQLCLYVVSSNKVFDEGKEMHGLNVVSDQQLRKDLIDSGEIDLANELDEVVGF